MSHCSICNMRASNPHRVLTGSEPSGVETVCASCSTRLREKGSTKLEGVTIAPLSVVEELRCEFEAARRRKAAAKRRREGRTGHENNLLYRPR